VKKDKGADVIKDPHKNITTAGVPQNRHLKSNNSKPHHPRHRGKWREEKLVKVKKLFGKGGGGSFAEGSEVGRASKTRQFLGRNKC